MLERYIVFIQDNTDRDKQTVTTRIIFSRTPYGAKRLGRIASREIFSRYDYYNSRIVVNVWRLQQLEDSWYDNNHDFLRRSNIRIGKTVFSIADPTDTKEKFDFKMNKMQKKVESLKSYFFKRLMRFFK